MNGLECDHNKDYTNCQAMNRLFAALKYYSMLNISENKSDREFVTEFMTDIYSTQFIDDYIHFNNHHSQDIEMINRDITNENNDCLFMQCQIELCAFTNRHHQRTDKTQGNTVLSPTVNFFKQTMDSFHFYLFHCFDVGLRIKKEEYKTEQKNGDKQNKKYFDATFSRMNKMISERKHSIQS